MDIPVTAKFVAAVDTALGMMATHPMTWKYRLKEVAKYRAYLTRRVQQASKIATISYRGNRIRVRTVILESEPLVEISKLLYELTFYLRWAGPVSDEMIVCQKIMGLMSLAGQAYQSALVRDPSETEILSRMHQVAPMLVPVVTEPEVA